MNEADIFENNPLWIVDVGASGGVHSRWEEFTTSYKGVLFEPDPREYDILKSKCGKNLIVINSALSDSSSLIDFHLCRKQQVSSVFRPNFEFLDKFPYSERFDILESIEIQADTLDSQLEKKNIEYIDFIKIDTQGYELAILKGGTRYLDGVTGLEIEVEFSQLYENQPLFDEVDRFIRENGFTLFDLKRCYWKRKESRNTGNYKGQLVFGDALYFRSPEQVMFMNGVNEEQIVRSIGVYLSYGYVDLAKSLLQTANKKEFFTNAVSSALDKMIAILDKKNPMPDFKGRRRIQYLFEAISKSFDRGFWNSGTDREIGN